MCFGIIYKSAHGPGVMFFRIIVQPVRILLVATNKNSVIHYPLRQPLRVPVRSLIQLCPASPRPLLLTPVQPHGFQQAAHLLADEVAGDDVARITHKDHVAVRPHHFVPLALKPRSLKLCAFTSKNIYPELRPVVVWACRKRLFVVCSCASGEQAFHGLCPSACRSRNLMPAFTDNSPR